MAETDRFFIITGGPGSGKSTLIEALAAQGVPCMPEAGRAIIQEEMAAGGKALPWDDRLAFAERMFVWETSSWHAAHQHAGRVLFDRAVPDVVGYLRLVGLPVPQHIEEAAHTLRYHRRVFIAPHWPEIYAQDKERKQSIEEAEATFRTLADTYVSLGYELMPLPLASIPERVAFVRGVIG